MRALTSIQSSTAVKADMEFHLKLSDQSTTFIFDRDDIAELTPINWEIPFGGGFGKPSNYQVTLSTSVDFIKTYKKQIVNGEGSLKIFVNSDNFVPSIGRVRDIQRFPKNLNQLQLNVYDKFLDTNPKIPIQSIVDSYSGAHPEVINSDMGYPLYYGKHTRPFYMTAVDCDVANLLGPLNVSSENHVTSLWYNEDLLNYTEYSNYHVTGFSWSQQSGSDNTASGSFPFEISGKLQNNIFEWGGPLGGPDWQRSFKTSSDLKGQYKGTNVASLFVYCEHYPVLTAFTNESVYRVLRVRGFATVGGKGVSSDTNHPTITAVLFPRSEAGSYGQVNLFSEATTVSNSFAANLYDTIGENIMKRDWITQSYFYFQHWGITHLASTIVVSMDLDVQLQSSAYRNYSIFGSQVNCTDIAISENPMGIVADIIDQTSFGFVASQNSQAQYDTSSYHFQAFIGERENLTTILSEIGQAASTYMWIGDSGFINFNTYQQSSTLVESGLIAATITTCDFLDGSLRILDNPLGTTVFNTQKASRIKVDYDYDFGTQLYNKSNVANPQNNAFCESADASGIQTQITVQTKYIKEAFTSSLYLSNIARHSTQDEMIVEMDLPARFFNLELSDVVKLQHPVLVGSESLFQITKIKPDYLGGIIRMTANEILNL